MLRQCVRQIKALIHSYFSKNNQNFALIFTKETKNYRIREQQFITSKFFIDEKLMICGLKCISSSFFEHLAFNNILIYRNLLDVIISSDLQFSNRDIIYSLKIMNSSIYLLFWMLALAHRVAGLVNTICSIYCPATACNGTGGYNICQSCDSVFDLYTSQTPTCQVQPLTGYCFQSITPTTLTASYTSYPQYTACGSITNIHGWFTTSQTITISNPGITRQFYSIKIIFGIVQKGSWGGAQQVMFKFSNTNNIQWRGIMTRDVTLNGTCSPSNDDYYSRHILDYDYTVQNTTLSWDVYISGSGGTGAAWAFNQVILLLKSCYQRCNGCSPTNCMQCTACQTSGPYESYFISSTSRCVAAADCPALTFASSATHRCESCSISNCQRCSTASVCAECATNYYLSSGSCVSTCPSGYFPDSSVTPRACTQCPNQCTACTSSTSCSACTTSGTYESFLSSSSCLAAGSCPSGTYSQSSNHTCSSCNTSCATCQTTRNTCTQCVSGLYLLDNVCYSDCPGAYYESSAAQKQCLACNQRCTACDVSDTNCTACTTSGTYQSYLVSSSKSCVASCPAGTSPDATTHTCIASSSNTCSQFCLTCTGRSAYQCSSCDSSQHRILVNTQCKCDPYNYRQSSTGPVCQAINPNLCSQGYLYSQSTGQCVQICGDGMRLTYDCDDGNTLNNDGCSNLCAIESGYTCSSSGTDTSVCRLIVEVQFVDVKITKDEFSNTLYFQISILPKSLAYSNYNLAQYLQFQGAQIGIQAVSYEESSSKLYLQANYSTNLQQKQVRLQVRSSYYYDSSHPNVNETQYTTNKATFRLSASMILLRSSNNLEINAYSDQQYAQVQIFSKLNLAILIIGLVCAFGCLLIKNSISTMININALQICYLSLVAIQGMPPLTATILAVRPILGYNDPNMFGQDNTLDSTAAESLGFVQAFSNNFNIMLFVQIGLLGFAGLLSVAAEDRTAIKQASKFLQRQGLLLTIFNLPNAFFAITLIRQITLFNLIFPIGVTVILLYQVFRLFTDGSNYFAFPEVFSFTDDGHFKKFVISFFSLRIGCCISLSLIFLKIYINLSSALICTVLFLVFIAIFRPFYHLLSNIFIIIGEFLLICFMGCIFLSQVFNLGSKIEGIGMLIYLMGAIAIVTLASLVYGIFIDLSQRSKSLRQVNQKYQSKRTVKIKQ